jgi:hypothetical protein
VQWLGKAYKFAFRKHYIPLNTTTGGILNKGKRVRAFHITSPKKLNQLNSLQGTKKSISCMQRIPLYTYGDKIRGAWHQGIMFYLEGTLLLKGDSDIMSEPDEQGRRWVGLPYRYHNKWEKVVAKDEVLNKLRKQMNGTVKVEPKILKAYPDNAENYLLYKALFRYIELAEKFVKQNRKGIIDEFNNAIEPGGWDELVLNDIELIDAIWDGKEGDRKKVESKLKSMVSGQVIAPKKYNTVDGNSFIKNRKVK